MQKHTKIYMDYFGYDISDYIPCESCGSRAQDVHHIDNKGMGGSKEKDYIENLAGLCRTCHDLCHEFEEVNQKVKHIHLINVKRKEVFVVKT